MFNETWKDKIKKFENLGENRGTLRKVACPKCGNIGAEVVKEDLQTQGSIVTFKCTKCEYDFKEEY